MLANSPLLVLATLALSAQVSPSERLCASPNGRFRAVLSGVDGKDGISLNLALDEKRSDWTVRLPAAPIRCGVTDQGYAYGHWNLELHDPERARFYPHEEPSRWLELFVVSPTGTLTTLRVCSQSFVGFHRGPEPAVVDLVACDGGRRLLFAIRGPKDRSRLDRLLVVDPEKAAIIADEFAADVLPSPRELDSIHAIRQIPGSPLASLDSLVIEQRLSPRGVPTYAVRSDIIDARTLKWCWRIQSEPCEGAAAMKAEYGLLADGIDAGQLGLRCRENGQAVFEGSCGGEVAVSILRVADDQYEIACNRQIARIVVK